MSQSITLVASIRLAAPDTIDTMPGKTLLAELACEGATDRMLAADLQREGTAAFAKSWNELMLRIASKRGPP